MKFFETSKYYSLNKTTYIKLRWIASIGQFLTINIVKFKFNFDFDFILCNLIILAGIFSNFYLKYAEYYMNYTPHVLYYSSFHQKNIYHDLNL